MKGTAPSRSPDLLADRYGRDRRRGRPLLVAAVSVLALAGLAWVAWAAWFQGNPDVQSGLVRSRVVDAHHVSADIAVSFRTPHIVADCLVQAQASDHTVVGELDFRVGPVASEHITVHKTMRTERPAVVVSLVGCTTPDQKRPR
jgi:hypothetical protein